MMEIKTDGACGCVFFTALDLSSRVVRLFCRGERREKIHFFFDDGSSYVSDILRVRIPPERNRQGNTEQPIRHQQSGLLS
jgi:hypothetical protein